MNLIQFLKTAIGIRQEERDRLLKEKDEIVAWFDTLVATHKKLEGDVSSRRQAVSIMKKKLKETRE